MFNKGLFCILILSVGCRDTSILTATSTQPLSSDACLPPAYDAQTASSLLEGLTEQLPPSQTGHAAEVISRHIRDGEIMDALGEVHWFVSHFEDYVSMDNLTSGQASNVDLTICQVHRILLGLYDSRICSPDECGNGIVGPNEQCDDGNSVPWDGCEVDCRHSSPGWRHILKSGDVTANTYPMHSVSSYGFMKVDCKGALVTIEPLGQIPLGHWGKGEPFFDWGPIVTEANAPLGAYVLDGFTNSPMGVGPYIRLALKHNVTALSALQPVFADSNATQFSHFDCINSPGGFSPAFIYEPAPKQVRVPHGVGFSGSTAQVYDRDNLGFLPDCAPGEPPFGDPNHPTNPTCVEPI